MKRDLLNALHAWKKETKRKPLIIRGARQVGKTWLIEQFAQNAFHNRFTINFELQPEFRSCFEVLDPEEICTRIELTGNTRLSNADTLLCLDEIQECPAALQSLRYFYEKKPELFVIAAGSLLEFLRKSEEISIPVGRVVNYHLLPLSFGEFLDACGEERLRRYLRDLSIHESIPASIAHTCTGLLRTYLYTGGMPAATADWLDRRSFEGTDLLHQSLLQNYRSDFGKYGKRVNIDVLEDVFLKLPGHIGGPITYSAITRDYRIRDIKRAITLLEKARLITRVRATSGTGLPLITYADEKRIKLLFLDTGLYQNAMGIGGETYLAPDLLAVYRGAVTEHYVGQQLLALRKPFEEPVLFFWHRTVPGSRAEVDYLYQHRTAILPVEVKSGKTGSLKSLRRYLAEHPVPLGIRFSQHPLSFADGVLSIPLFAVEALPGLVRQALEKS